MKRIDENSIQLEDDKENELRFRVEQTLKSGIYDPTMYVKAASLKNLFDELDRLRCH